MRSDDFSNEPTCEIQVTPALLDAVFPEHRLRPDADEQPAEDIDVPEFADPGLRATQRLARVEE